MGCSKSQGLTLYVAVAPFCPYVRKKTRCNYAFGVLLYIFAATLFPAGVEPRLLNLLKCKKRKKSGEKRLRTYLMGRKEEGSGEEIKKGEGGRGKKGKREDRGGGGKVC